MSRPAVIRLAHEHFFINNVGGAMGTLFSEEDIIHGGTIFNPTLSMGVSDQYVVQVSRVSRQRHCFQSVTQSSGPVGAFV